MMGIETTSIVDNLGSTVQMLGIMALSALGLYILKAIGKKRAW
jgi:hypothetical protein